MQNYINSDSDDENNNSHIIQNLFEIKKRNIREVGNHKLFYGK